MKKNISKSSPVHGKEFKIELLNAAQKAAWAGFQKHDVLFLIGPAGTGKAQPLDALVYTPNRPKKMGDIKIGDVVCTPDGNTANVIGTYPQGKKPIYKITFSDGASTECCSEHLWKICSPNWNFRYKVLQTKDIIKKYKTPKNRNCLFIDTTSVVRFQESDLPINPYVLGVLIGDGNITNKVAFTSADKEIVKLVSRHISDGYIVKKTPSQKYDYCIRKIKRSNAPNLILEDLKKLEICRSWEKFIPKSYIYNSKEVRIELLRGLMDTDGTVDKREGISSFTTTSKQLANDFLEIIQSLGMGGKIIEKNKNYTYKGKKLQGRTAYQICIRSFCHSDLFNLSRKKKLTKVNTDKSRIRRYIKNIEYIGDKEAQCIMLDNIDHLYLTDNFIVTHNSFMATAFAIKSVLGKEKEKIIVTRPIVEAGEKLGFLPGDFYAKVDPYIRPIYDCMDKLVGVEGVTREKIMLRTEIAPIAFMRGRSFSDSICIFDEAQNANLAQLKLFLTRLGTNSKMIITGDPKQSDISDSALMLIVEKLHNVAGIGVVEFKNNSIIRHPLVGSMLDAIEK